jgi:thiol-disulfide isomerase/thioredoxin
MKGRRIPIALLALAACASSTPGLEGTVIPSAPVSLRIDRIDGPVLTLGSLRGRVVLVTVFTTWADYALLEVPKMKKLATTYDSKDFVVVAIALDTNPKMVRIFARTFDIPYYVGTIDDPAAFTSESGPFGKITLIPTSLLLDREGRIAARMDGLWPDGILEEAVGRLVAASMGSH